MSAPTLWEEGRWSGDRVTRLSVLVCVLALTVDLTTTGELGWTFDVAFVLACAGAALAVRPRDFFRVGVLPPLLLLGATIALSLFDRPAIATAKDGFAQGVVSGLATHSGALMVGYAVTLVVLAIRNRVISRSARHHAHSAHSNRAASPVP